MKGCLNMKDVYDLTTPQKSIWLTEQFYGKTNLNNVCGILSIEEKVDFEKLEIAINLFVKNNDSFQIRLLHKENEIKQYFADYTFFNINKILVQSEKELKKLEKQIALTPFELIDSPLFSFTMFEYPTGIGGFIINCHHIIADSWTNGIVANEVTKIYSDLINNKDYFEGKSFSYIDYISSEQNYIKSEKFQKDKQYWNDLLKCVPESGIIPSVKNNLSASKETSLGADRLLLSIDDTLLSSINEFCKKNRVSSYNFFMAVYAIYIGRVSNLDDFMIGTPILNRTNYHEKNTTGMFINTIPFKFSIKEKVSFSQFVSTVAKDSLNMLKHQKYSYQYIIEDLRKSSPGLPGLYNIILSYQITKMNQNIDTVPHNTAWTFNGTIADDLDIHLYEWNENNSLHIAYDYKTCKYDKNDLTLLHLRILHMINQILNNNEIDITKIEIVIPEEKHKLLYEFNNTKVAYPKDKTIVELFEEQAEKTPDKIAVVFEDKQMTYKELNEKANCLANYFRNNNITSTDIITVFLDKSIEVIVSFLAILKIGAIYLPIDVNYPQKRIDYIIDNSKAKLMLVNQNTNLSFSIPIVNVNIKNTDIYNDNNFEFHRNPNELTPDNTAYITYTSGSTGNPKGVMVSHKNVVRLVKNTNYISFNKEEHILQTGSIVFDASTFEIWGALLNGLQLYLMKKEDLLNPSLFEQYLLKNKITIMFITTALFNKFCEENPNMFRHLKYLLTGGEAVSKKHMIIAKKANPNLNLVHCYGPTENTTFSTCYLVNDISKGTIPIGSPIANSSCYVVSKSGSIQPIGIPGELWVGGDGVAKGYLNNSTLTSEKFIRNPFVSNDIIYKTGDLVKMLPDGNIEFIGRIDNQVKIRGFRIELSEIDSKILEYPNIKESITMIHMIGDIKWICSYFVSNTNIVISEMKNFLKESLPSYMVPNFFMQLDSLPVNINGKIDKKLLPLPKIEKKEFIKPRNSIEKEIFDHVSEIMHTSDISITDNLINDIGMDSLNMMSLSTKLAKYNILIQTIIDNPSIEKLAALVSRQSTNLSTIYDNKLQDVNIIDHTLNFDLSTILLTGCTGFLGIHILSELLVDNSVKKIYCLIRKKNGQDSKDRLLFGLSTYLNSDMKILAEKKVEVLDGNFVFENLGLSPNAYAKITKQVTTVIHCGANVKHYGNYDDFYDSNVNATKKMIKFCQDSGAYLAHISTLSVGGFCLKSNIIQLDEDRINIGQKFGNQVYMFTKYEAECEVLRAIENRKIYGVIFRLGNIMPRLSDGVFQYNASDNAFISRISTIMRANAITTDFKNIKVDLSPVDLCAKSICLILKHKTNHTVYHIFNDNPLSISNLLKLANLSIDEVKTEDLISRITNLNNPLDAHLINDLKLSEYIETPAINTKTSSHLKKLGFSWNMIDSNYVKSIINIIS